MHPDFDISSGGGGGNKCFFLSNVKDMADNKRYCGIVDYFMHPSCEIGMGI